MKFSEVQISGRYLWKGPAPLEGPGEVVTVVSKPGGGGAVLRWVPAGEELPAFPSPNFDDQMVEMKRENGETTFVPSSELYPLQDEE